MMMSLLLFSTKFVSGSTNSSVCPPYLLTIFANVPDLCGFNVLQACKQMPDVAAGLAAAFFTLIGMLAALFGLMGSSKPVVCHLNLLLKPANETGQEDQD